MYCFFLFKQKTAYEMRISDWSSDVCSSDLGVCGIGLCVIDRGCGDDPGPESATNAERTGRRLVQRPGSGYAVSRVSRCHRAVVGDHGIAVELVVARAGDNGGVYAMGGEIGRAHV